MLDAERGRTQVLAIILNSVGRRQEGLALLRFAVRTAIDNDKPTASLRASYNLCDQLGQFDRYSEAVDAVRDGLGRAAVSAVATGNSPSSGRSIRSSLQANGMRRAQ